MIFRIFHYSIHRNASDKIRVKVSLFSWGCGFKLVESIFFQMQPRPDMLLLAEDPNQNKLNKCYY